ncbi:MAG: hypothetical protein DYH05_08755 [Acidobacteria bacterium ACB1]|nr:hypothetical protein [Pyrinomonadaceae bacterium]MCE7962571.1 hypothetical protein [Acidobacteria bacterium ACB1]RIJ94211.1 MAG: hypothetical protein DCC44_05085 [Acidobacteriota bacterium]
MEDSISVSTTEYTSFDILGRVTAHKQTADGQNYTTGYVYNLSGALIEETYPSGRVVKNTLDTDGSLSQVQSKRLNDSFRNYANSFTYTAAGAVIARHDYLPFGEEIDGTGGRTAGLNYGDDTIRKQFTGYERDTETSLDFAQARMYANTLAHFTLPDALHASATAGDPRTATGANEELWSRSCKTF